MKPEQVFKRYDIRGSYPEEIDEEFAERLGRALGTFSSENYSSKVVVGKDTKGSSVELKDAFIEGLESTGTDVLDAGTGPTDYIAFTGRYEDAVSVQVTSSHLELETNGFKFMYPEGNGFLNPDLYEVQDLFLDEEFLEGEGSSRDIEDSSRERYMSEVKDYLHRFNGGINSKVVVDTLGGASTDFLPELLEDIGAEVVDIASEREEGPYLNPPDPKPGNLGYLEDRYREEDADLVLATDMDADRVAVYNGEWLTGDELFAVFAQLIEGDIVASIDTSSAVEEIVEKRRDEIHYTRVGDPFVVQEALDREVKLAGEPNGHYCFPDFVPYNSGTLAALIAAKTDLDRYLDEVPDYYTDESSVKVDDKEERMADVVETAIDNYEVVSDLDGVKFRLDDATALVRPSGSSPLVRVKTESKSAESSLKALEEVEQMIRNP